MRGTIRSRLSIIFLGLAIGPLLLVGIVLAWQSFTVQKEQALTLQQQVARRASTQVDAFIRDRESELRMVSQVRGLLGLDREQQRRLLSELQSYDNIFETLVLLDGEGQEQIRLSRLEVVTDAQLQNRSEAEEFVFPKATNETYYSPVWFDQTTREPFMIIAVPLFNVRSGSVDGVLMADVRIKKVWELIGSVPLDEGESIYIVDTRGKVIAHRNPSVVLRGTQFSLPDQDGIGAGLDSASAVLAVDRIPLGEQEFFVVAEKSLSQALSLAINTVVIMVTVIVGALLVAGFLAFQAVRQIVQPIQSLATSAEAIRGGDLSQRVEVASHDELGLLADVFNRMTSQLQELIGSLEERVAARTQRLELLASLSERLSAILDLDQLLSEVVNQIQTNFGYYHAHIYLLDETGERLIVATGTGEAGAEMKKRGHSILLKAPTSLVARAARSGEIVKVDNVREAEDWLANPLLPNTYAEMAVPILLEGQVVGVLDVQEDEIAGLDEGDANLLRSLANQVAVTIRNARLFNEVENALAEARVAQERYIERSWDRAKIWTLGGQYHYARPDVSTLDEETLSKIKQQILSLSRPAMITVNDGPAEPQSQPEAPKSIIAPISYQSKTIGALQLHPASEDQLWTEDDLAVVEAVADQLAQSAESIRLFEMTRERAGREQLARQITDKIRSSRDLEAALKTAAEELSNALNLSTAKIKWQVPSEDKAAEHLQGTKNGATHNQTS